MRRLLLGLALSAAAVALPQAPAAAGWVCVGTSGTLVACVNDQPVVVDPAGGNYTDCVFVGPPPCRPVSVDYPTVTVPPGCKVALGGALLPGTWEC